MMMRVAILAFTLAALQPGFAHAQQTAGSQEAAAAPAPPASAAGVQLAPTPSEGIASYEKVTGEKLDWSKFLADSAPGSIGASTLLGLDGEAVHHPENVKDLMLSLKGLSGSGKQAFGLGVTPARTAITPMSLATYARGLPERLLGSTTLGYAQGNTTISSQAFRRRAYSVETSAYLDPKDDPVLAFATSLSVQGGPCQIFESLQPGGPVASPVDEAPKPANAPAVEPGLASANIAQAVMARAKQCRDMIKARWNASSVSLAYASGRISPDAGGPDVSLGHVAQFGFTYGFDSFGRASALTLTYRWSNGEPVLASLVSGPVQKRGASFAAMRYTIGSTDFKALVEASNQKDDAPTSSETVFKRAVGIDYKVRNGWWLNLRTGRKMRVDGSGQESASLIGLSISPPAADNMEAR